MEGPIQPRPVDHVVPYGRTSPERRRPHDDARRERPFALPGEAQTDADPSAPATPPERPAQAHEDGVGENLDLTA